MTTNVLGSYNTANMDTRAQEKMMDGRRLLCAYVTHRMCWLQKKWLWVHLSFVGVQRQISSLNNITMHLKLKGHTFCRVSCTLLNPCRTGPALRWQSQRIVWAQIRGCRPRQQVLAQLCDVHTIRVMLLKWRSSFTSCFCDSEPQAAVQERLQEMFPSSKQPSGAVQNRESRRVALGGHILPFLWHSSP